MGGAKKSTWIGGTAFLCVVILIGAWFMLIAPKRADAASVRDEAAQVEAQNDVLEAKVASLAADFKRLPELKEQLAAYRVGIPTEAQLSQFIKHLAKIADDRSVVIENITPATPQEVALATSTAPAAEPTPSPSATETPAADSSESSTTSDSTAAPKALVPQGFTAVPFTITVIGKYADTTAFLSDLQSTKNRLFLVGGVTGTGQPKQDASAGKPATELGDQELVVTGFAYVLPDTTTAATPAPVPTAGPDLPKDKEGKGPYGDVKGKK